MLALSANTSFGDFPALPAGRARSVSCRSPSRTAADGSSSRSASSPRGLSGLLLILFGGITDGLIPLFAIGAFFAFTMSQIGMVIHWRRRREPGATRSLVVNAVGATATATTLVLVLASKFVEGAWITVLLVAGMILLMRSVRAHYEFIDE